MMTDMHCKTMPIKQQTPLRTFFAALITAALMVSQTAQATVEITGPAHFGEPPARPQMLADPHRPSGSPTSAAIERITQEDGPGAGLQLAQNALSGSQRAYGEKDARTIIPRLNVANAIQRTGRDAESLIEYRKIIQMIEAAGGPRDARLVDAWNGVAFAHLNAGQFSGAQLAYEASLQLGRVNLGLNNVAQLEKLHALAIAQQASGAGDDAHDTQVRRLKAGEQIFGMDSPETANLYVSVGRWFRINGRVSNAIALHSLAVGILDKDSEHEPELTEALIEVAISASKRPLEFDQTPLPRNARPRSALERAEALVTKDSSLAAETRAAKLIRIADAHISQNRASSAVPIYQQAASLLASVGQAAPYSAPVFIEFAPPFAEAVPGKGGDVVAEFTVSEKGAVEQMQILEHLSIPVANATIQNLRRSLRSAILRPRIVNGVPVETRNVRFRLAVRGGSA